MEGARRNFNLEKAVVFTAAITIYYCFHRQYELPITAQMRKFEATKYFDDTHGNDVRWLWTALMSGRTQKQVFEVLPKRYQKEQMLYDWGVFYSKTLCSQRSRISTLEEMWDELTKLLPDIDNPPKPGSDGDLAMPDWLHSHPADVPKVDTSNVDFDQWIHSGASAANVGDKSSLKGQG